MFGDPEKELIQKISELVSERFGGNYKTAFDHYAQKQKSGPLIGRDELLTLLADADIGNTFTRRKWADGVLERLDNDGDGCISYAELQKLI